MVRRSVRSLTELFSKEASDVGLKERANHGSKRIISPGGMERFVPGYLVDFVETSDKVVTRFDNTKWAGNPNWNLERTTQETVKLASTFPAIHHDTPRARRVTDKT